MDKEEIKRFVSVNLTDICYGDKPKDKDGNTYVYSSEDNDEYLIYLITPTGNKQHVANYMEETAELYFL